MHDITVVFDGYKAGRGNESLAVRGGVSIIYSGLGERADEVIKRIIAKNRKEWIVVSSDKDIVRYAWSVNSIPVPSEEFLEKVYKEAALKDIPLEAGAAADIYGADELKDSGEYDEVVSSRKGNSYKLSKREKSVRRALSKL